MNNVEHAVLKLFESVPDPRKPQKMYALPEILLLTTIALWVGCEDFTEIHSFCIAKKDLLKSIFGIQRIPSHDTFNRVVGLINPTHFEGLFRQMMQEKIFLDTVNPLNHIALDGKTISKSHLHMVSAFETQSGLVFASQDTGKGKKNELATMVEIVKSMKLDGCVITSDAMGCNDKLFAAIVQQKADYTIQLKANQSNALDSVQTCFDIPSKSQNFGSWEDESTKERTGVVQRQYQVCSTLKDMPFLEFTGLKSIVKVLKTITQMDGVVSHEVRYYLSSLTEPKTIASSIRRHWAIENNLHWQLDVSFGEDSSRILDKNCQKNLSLMRKIILNTFKLQGVTNAKKHKFKMLCDNNYFITEMKKIAM
jgi:predicted transposase YbfD/YdcC